MSLKLDFVFANKNDRGVIFALSLETGDLAFNVDIGPRNYKAWERFLADIAARKRSDLTIGGWNISHAVMVSAGPLITFQSKQFEAACEIKVLASVCLPEFERLLESLKPFST